ncbi:MAG: hypothetical protein K2X79_10305 [Burkholderiaceae bacterium]|nr:hypothetical protein [Burkholderiaceae bacterium]
MKYFLVLAVVLVVVWRWRSARSSAVPPKQAAQSQPPLHPTDMVACRHCGLHLPSTDALAGRKGHYCSSAHRQAAEG